MKARLAALLLALLGLTAVPAPADDTDIFLNNTANTATRPNVLIIVDNTANWNTQFTYEMSALQTVVNGLSSNLNVGIMMFKETGSGWSNTNGSYIRYAIRQMTSANKTSLVSLVTGLNKLADKSNNATYALAMHEAYLYFGGQAAYAGGNGANSSTKVDSAAFASTNVYQSPISDACQKNYIIVLSNGPVDNGENTAASTLLGNLGGKLASDPISLTPNGEVSSWTDEYARFVYAADVNSSTAGIQNIVSYTIDVNPGSTGQGPSHTALLKSVANQGGGKYFTATDATTLTQALNDIFTEVQAVNSVFASSTLPVSVNVRGTYLNQVYMGVFRPDADGLPRWLGNLKEYQLAVDSSTNTLFLADVNGSLVTNSTTGFVNPGVTSYWTTNSSFWTYHPTGSGGASDAPDGDIVEKGAAAQWLRTNFATSQTGRNLYTCTGSCTGGSSLSATPFATSNTSITQAATGTTSASDLSNLIAWVRGQDLYDENINGSTTDVRASIHGDVLHSRPAVVNYNRYGTNNDIYVYYGANDGIFHAIHGGQDSTGGTEQWGFVPSEFFGQLKRLRDNNVTIISPNPSKPYFMDGPISIYQKDANNDGKYVAGDNDKVYLYIGMRRGGRFIYALDLSDPTAPKLLWKKSNTDTGYGELGQTWSMPKQPVSIRASSNPVLIIGAGYDPTANDATPQGTATMGRGVMVIDAITGSVLWQAGPSPSGATSNKTVSGMTYSIPAEMTVLDRNSDGYADRVYAADTGGNVWRLDIGDASPANWQVTLLASLGGTGADARKFLYPPDVVYGQGTQNYDAVLIGSGDREHPFDTTVTNRFYMIKDPYTINVDKSLRLPPANFTAITETNLYDATNNLIQVGSASQQAAALSSLQAAKGWYVTLVAGEKVVGNATTLSGTTFFGTNRPTPPAPGVCTANLGEARLYSMSYLNATATIENNGSVGLTTADRYVVKGQGYPPSPVPVLVKINNTPYMGVISGTQVQTAPTTPLGKRARTYWHMEIDQ